MQRCIGLFAVLLCAMGITVDVAAASGSQFEQGTDAGELRSFEKSVSSGAEETEQKKPRTKSSQEGEHDDDDEDADDELAEGFVGAVFNLAGTILSEGGKSTLRRIDPETDPAMRREAGEPLTAFIRFDLGFQRVSTDITARFNRLEGGYGPVALVRENYHFTERVPASTLNIERTLLLYRMSDNNIEIDIGLGQSNITGVEYTEINVVPVRFRAVINEIISMDVMASWGGEMDDYEIAMHVGRRFAAAKIGYRSLRSAGSSLSGPFAGMAFYF